MMLWCPGGRGDAEAVAERARARGVDSDPVALDDVDAAALRKRDAETLPEMTLPSPGAAPPIVVPVPPKLAQNTPELRVRDRAQARRIGPDQVALMTVAFSCT